MITSRPPRTIAAFALGLALAAGPLAACSADDDPNKPVTEDVYCADKDGKVLPESYCDDDGGGNTSGFPGFIWIGGFGGGHAPGYQLDRSRMSDQIRYNDAAGRTRAGLPAKGRVTGTGGLGGTVTRTRAQAPNAGKGIPKAGTGSKGGGFGSGSKGGGTGS